MDFFVNQTLFFSETPAFKSKSYWNPPKEHPCLEVLSSQIEKDFSNLLFFFKLLKPYKRRMDSDEMFDR